jgi:hypothetical protein
MPAERRLQTFPPSPQNEEVRPFPDIRPAYEIEPPATPGFFRMLLCGLRRVSAKYRCHSFCHQENVNPRWRGSDSAWARSLE